MRKSINLALKDERVGYIIDAALRDEHARDMVDEALWEKATIEEAARFTKQGVPEKIIDHELSEEVTKEHTDEP
jgi:hypothetical protein